VLHFSRLKIFSIFFIIFVGFLYFIPNFLKSDHLLLPNKKVVLGLDLQGGSYLLLEVNSKPLFEEKLELKSFDIRKELRCERLNYKNFKTNNLNISFEIDSDRKTDFQKIFNSNDINQKLNETDKELIYIFTQNNVQINFSETYLKRVKKNAMEQSLEIIRSRIDELGTREPTIIAQGDERILVELPGIKNPKKIKDIIGTTARK